MSMRSERRLFSNLEPCLCRLEDTDEAKPVVDSTSTVMLPSNRSDFIE